MALTEEQKAKKRAYYKANKDRYNYTSKLGSVRTFLREQSSIEDLLYFKAKIKTKLDKKEKI